MIAWNPSTEISTEIHVYHHFRTSTSLYVRSYMSSTPTAIQTLVHAFVCTRIDFANSLLYGTSAYLLDRLQSVLNSAARLILKIGKYDPISSTIRRDLHWLPIRFRVHFKLNSITSNCLAGRAPEYLTELCHSANDIPARRNLRSSSQVQLLVPRFRKERSGRRGFSVSSPQLWNLLPVDIRLHHNEHQLFRRRLKLIICNSHCYTTEDLCHQCELYYYYLYRRNEFCDVMKTITFSD